VRQRSPLSGPVDVREYRQVLADGGDRGVEVEERRFVPVERDDAPDVVACCEGRPRLVDVRSVEDGRGGSAPNR